MDLSYGVYLYAFPVQQLLVLHFAPNLTPLRLFLAATVITCGLAALSWHLVEEPFLRLKPKPQLAPPAVPDNPALHRPASTLLPRPSP